MRRSVEEGVVSRFVTGERVQAVLKVFLLPSHKIIDDITYFIPGNAKSHYFWCYGVHGRRPDTPRVE